jgi:hypothetical protein
MQKKKKNMFGFSRLYLCRFLNLRLRSSHFIGRVAVMYPRLEEDSVRSPQSFMLLPSAVLYGRKETNPVKHMASLLFLRLIDVQARSGERMNRSLQFGKHPPPLADTRPLRNWSYRFMTGLPQILYTTLANTKYR